MRYSAMRITFIFIFLCSFSNLLFSQSLSRTILQINENTFEMADFEEYCKKNNHTENIKQCLNDYIIYCLKLIEAESQGIDKRPQFKREMAKFRSEAAAPYLNINRINEEFVKQEWTRLHENNEISNILIPIPLNERDNKLNYILPKDTLPSFQKAMEIYDLCINNNYFDTDKNMIIDYKPFDMGIVRALTIPLSIEDALYKMKTGDISKPIRTKYGYHIIKINNKHEENQPAYTPQIQNNIIAKIKQTEASTQYLSPILEKMKADNNFSKNKVSYSELRSTATELHPISDAFISKFENDKHILFTAQNYSITISDFVYYLKQKNKSHATLSTDLLEEQLMMFEFYKLNNIEDHLLEARYPKIVKLLSDCRKDLMILGITDRETREKAVSDTVGLKTFFEQHKDKYSWKKPRFKGFVVHAQTTSDRSQMQTETANMDIDSAFSFLQTKYLSKKQESAIKIGQKGIYIEGRDEYVDELIFKSEKKGIPYLEYPRYFVVGKLIEQPENYTDVLSFVTNDYQKHLENKWLESLKEKYTIKINEKLIKELQ